MCKPERLGVEGRSFPCHFPKILGLLEKSSDRNHFEALNVIYRSFGPIRIPRKFALPLQQVLAQNSPFCPVRRDLLLVVRSIQ